MKPDRGIRVGRMLKGERSALTIRTSGDTLECAYALVKRADDECPHCTERTVTRMRSGKFHCVGCGRPR